MADRNETGQHQPKGTPVLRAALSERAARDLAPGLGSETRTTPDDEITLEIVRSLLLTTENVEAVERAASDYHAGKFTTVDLGEAQDICKALSEAVASKPSRNEGPGA